MNSSSVISEFVLPGAKPHYNPDKKIDLVHQILDLAVSFNTKTIVGSTTILAQSMQNGLQKIEINAVGMTVSQVIYNKKPLVFNYDGKIINIDLPKKFKKAENLTLTIKYSLTNPVAGAFFIRPNKDYPNKATELWTTGESETNRYWFPCLDSPQQIGTFRINLRVPQEFSTISSGLLIKDTKVNPKDELIKELAGFDPSVSAKNYHLYEWQQSVPQATYLTAIVVGIFDEVKDSYKDIKVNYYTSKGKGGLLKDTAGKTPKMIEFFSKKFGVEFPFAKYYQFFAEDFNSGGMENASITINTDRVLSDKKIQKDWFSPEILVAHELAHQWFGDLVVIDHWSHLWIKEGMATYSECLWIEKEYGYQEFQYYRFGDLETYLAETYQRPTITNFYRNHRDLYDAHSYPKAGCVYHMLRSILGDSDFELVLKTFLESHKNSSVQSYDLLKVITKVTGKNLNWLFDRFLFNSGHPNLIVSSSFDSQNNLVKLEVEQKNLNSEEVSKLYPISVPVALNYVTEKQEIKSSVFNISIENPKQTYFFSVESKPNFISFDQNNNLIKELELKYSPQELEQQILYDPDPISRIYALKSIAKNNDLHSVEILEKAYIKEQFWGVRAEIAKSLKDIKLRQSQDLLLKMCEDNNSKVIRAALTSLAEFKNQIVYDYLYHKVQENQESVFVESQILKTLGVVGKYLGGQKEAELIEFYKTVLETKMSWGERIRAGAIGGLACLDSNPDALNLILEYTKAGLSVDLRNAAVSCLGLVSVNQDETLKNQVLDFLASLDDADNPFLENARITALSDIKSARSVQILTQINNSSPNLKSERRIEGIIEKISKSFADKNNLEELRKKIDKITQDNLDLKGKLEELMAISKTNMDKDTTASKPEKKKSKRKI